MNTYERHAYLYSSWVAVVIPAVLTMYILYDYIPELVGDYSRIVKIVETVLPIAVIYAALGYFIREIFRSTSKLLFQFPLFKEDETRMPSTEILLYSNKKLSETAKDSVRNYVLDDFNYQMPNRSQEVFDIEEARRSIVTAFGMIKNTTRQHELVVQSNYRYGFFRNSLGGLVVSLLVVLLLVLYFAVTKSTYLTASSFALFLLILQAFTSYGFMRMAALNYARTVINHYLSQHSK